MTVKAGTKADLYLSAAVATALPANDPTTADGTRTRYQLTAAARRYLDPNQPIVVQQDNAGGGVYATVNPSVTADEYTIEHATGTVVFKTARAVGTQVRLASGWYFTTSHVGGAHSWSMDLGVDIEDCTEFGAAWREKVTTLKDGSADVDRWWLDHSLVQRIVDGAAVVLVLHADYAAGSRYVAPARIASDSIEAAVDGLVEEALSFEFIGAAAYVPA